MLLDSLATLLERPLVVREPPVRTARSPTRYAEDVSRRISEAKDGRKEMSRGWPKLGQPLVRRDAIVVLGAPLLGDGALSPVVAERVQAAAALWHAGGGAVVVATGGVTRGARRAEAEAMAEALEAAGVPTLVEAAARTTADNARLTRPLLEARGVRSLWIVTQPYHGRRSVRLFRRAGFDAHAWHIDDSIQYRERGRAVRWLIREYAAWGRLLLSGG